MGLIRDEGLVLRLSAEGLGFKYCGLGLKPSILTVGATAAVIRLFCTASGLYEIKTRVQKSPSCHRILLYPNLPLTSTSYGKPKTMLLQGTILNLI